MTASGSAVLNFNFADLPYAAGQSVDLQGNGDVVFQFGSVPEPGIMLLLGSGLAALAVHRRRRTASGDCPVHT